MGRSPNREKARRLSDWHQRVDRTAVSWEEQWDGPRRPDGRRRKVQIPRTPLKPRQT